LVKRTWPKITSAIAQTISIGMPSTTGLPGGCRAQRCRSVRVAQPDEETGQDLAAEDGRQPVAFGRVAMPPMMVLRSIVAAGRW
jgi:hypothetical protein